MRDKECEYQTDDGYVGRNISFVCDLVDSACALVDPVYQVEGNKDREKKAYERLSFKFVFGKVCVSCGSVYPHQGPYSKGEERKSDM